MIEIGNNIYVKAYAERWHFADDAFEILDLKDIIERGKDDDEEEELLPLKSYQIY